MLTNDLGIVGIRPPKLGGNALSPPPHSETLGGESYPHDLRPWGGNLGGEWLPPPRNSKRADPQGWGGKENSAAGENFGGFDPQFWGGEANLTPSFGGEGRFDPQFWGGKTDFGGQLKTFPPPDSETLGGGEFISPPRFRDPGGESKSFPPQPWGSIMPTMGRPY